MSIIITLIIGAVIGWTAGQVAGRDEGLLGSVAIGIVGAFLGGLISNLLGSGDQTYFAFSWSGVAWSFIGAVVFAVILNGLQHRSQHVR